MLFTGHLKKLLRRRSIAHGVKCFCGVVQLIVHLMSIVTTRHFCSQLVGVLLLF